MRKVRALKYLTTLSLPVTVALAFSFKGNWTFLPLIYTFGMIPLAELLFRPDAHNLEKVEEDLIRKDPVYDWIVWAMVPLQYAFVLWFLLTVSQPGLSGFELAGLITSMGLMCGTFGINVGHELGHRLTHHERFLAKLALLSSLYMHFYIEHNRGHHKRVSTEADPASARYGEIVYAFWFRSMLFGFLSAWELEAERLRRKQLPVISLQNEMIRFQLFQLGLLAAIWLIFGLLPMLYFIAAAFMGGLLLETVNYIEHYGLQRKKLDEKRYERVQPEHSWNSNHVLGRLMLFELSRHSDHHYMASRKYQVLRHHDDSPQMPTGYPGMMVLALVPPLWFWVMHREIRRRQSLQAA